MTLVQSEKELFNFESRWEQLYHRPVLIYLLLVLIPISIPIIVLNLKLEVEFFYSLIIFPAIPIIYIENLWITKLKKDPTKYQSQYEVIKRHRASFLSSGLIFSLFPLLLPYLIMGSIKKTRFSILPIDQSTEFDSYGARSFNILLVFIFIFLLAFILSLSFFRIYNENKKQGSEEFYFNSVAIPQTLILYFLTPSYIGLNVMWVARFIQFGPTDEYFFFYSPNIVSIADQIFQGLTFVMIVFPVSILVFTFLIIPVVPNFIKDRHFQFSINSIIRIWIVKIVLAITILTLVTIISLDFLNFSTKNGQTLKYIALFLFPIVGIYFTSKLIQEGSYCNTCHFFYQNSCPFCTKKSTGRGIEISRFSKIIHPKCPNCRANWDTLNRRCQNCEFTIVLTCENCSQTINPLWKKCNLCGHPRRTIPELALSDISYPEFAIARQKLIYLGIFLFSFSIFLILLITEGNQLISQETDEEIVNELRFLLLDDISYVIYLGYIFGAIAILLILNRKMEQRPIFVLITRLTFILPEAILAMGLLLFSIRAFSVVSFSSGLVSVISVILMGSISILFLILFLRSRIKWILNFQPTVKLNNKIKS